MAANGQTGTTNTSFPIRTEEARFRNKATQDKMRGMHAAAQRGIERLQPFQIRPRDGHPLDQPLAKLHALEMRDKHRTLNLTNHVGDISFVGLPDEIHQPIAPSTHVIRDGAHREGEVLIRFSGWDHEIRPAPKVSIAHRLYFDGDSPCPAEDVVKTLAGLHSHVRDGVVPRFDQFF